MTTFDEAASVTELIRRRVAERGDAPAVKFTADAGTQPRTMSYAELDVRARRVAAGLGARLEAGDRVLLLYPLGLEFVAAFFGCLYAGMVAVPAPPPGRYAHQRRRTAGIAGDAGVRAVLTDTATLPAVTEWATGHSHLGLTVLDTEGNRLGDEREWTSPGLGRSALAMLQYTSGSTGVPKGVMVTHHNLLHNIGSLSRAMGLTCRTRFGGWVPLYHDMGLIGQLMPALFLGSECVLMSPTEFAKRPVRWLEMIDRFGIHWSAAPNFAYELCLRVVTDEQVAGLDLSRWEYSANGSEPVRAATLQSFAKRFAPAGFRLEALCPCYGLAEATVFVSGCPRREPVITTVDPGALERHEFRPVGSATGTDLTSSGVAHDHDVVVVDPETRVPLEPGRIGEIWLRGESVTSGYWRNTVATAATFGATTADGASGFLRTGDLGVCHDGELYITGRIKDMLIIRGRNLYPQDIEYEVRASHPELGRGVGAVFTVPAPDEEIVVTHELSGRLTHDELRRLTAGIRFTVLRQFGVRAAGVVLLRPGAVRRTTSGKIQRAVMRELFLDAELVAVHENLDRAVAAARREGAATDG